MGKKRDLQQKRCIYCGHFFKPDYRVKGRQKCCKAEGCQRKRKEEGRRRWVGANPGYFKGRYENTREWRKSHPDYQRQWRARRRREIQYEIPSKTPIKTIRLVIPEDWLKGEIQDEIRLVRQCGCGFFVSGKGMQDTRRDCPP